MFMSVMTLIGLSLISSKNFKSLSFTVLMVVGCVFMLMLTQMPGHSDQWMMSSFNCGWDLVGWALVSLSIWTTMLMLMASLYVQQSNLMFNKLTISFSLLLVSLMMSFTTPQFISFYIYFEATLIPTTVIILGWGYQPERLKAGAYMLFYTLFASLPLLLVILKGEEKNGTLIIGEGGLEMSMVWMIFLVAAFLVKLPVFMLHLWLPKAHVEAPVAGSMILAGVLLKLGGYGLLRVLPWTKAWSGSAGVWFSMGLMGGVFTGLLCLTQVDMKSLVAYSSIGHMGMALAGLFSLAGLGVSGAVVMMVAHGLCSSGLFSMVNMIYESSGSRMLTVSKGLLLVAPSAALWWFFLCVSNMACPPTINLVSEILSISSILSVSMTASLGLAMLVMVGVTYSLYLFIYVAHGDSYEKLSSSGFVAREYLLVLAHWVPLNLVTLKMDTLMI